jgi:adenine-specific DNA-methyltransferase
MLGSKNWSMNTMDGKSLDITDGKIEKLKAIIPEAFTEGKIDWEKLKVALGEDVEFKNERYVLNWAGKSDAFRILQSPTTATLVPCKEESVNFDNTENIFIEGENLEVLKVLQKSYFGKIKMIYIDPPYNTGNDTFIYPDKFSETKEEYLGRIGDKDETGYMTREGLFRKNSKDSGHYHSNWLSMMYPRLFLARNLLRDDGVIFVSIDDNEVHNLRLLMNEVFGEENFVEQIIWKKRSTPPNDQIIGAGHEYIAIYCKQSGSVQLNLRPRTKVQLDRYKNPDNHHKGPWTAGDLMANIKGGRYVKSLYFPITNPKTGEKHYPSSS